MQTESSSDKATEGSGISIQSVSKTYKSGKVKALDGLSLTIRAGEAFGIIGPNGAGKTTLFGCLLSFLRLDAGTITIDGLPPDALQTRRLVGYLPERLNFDRWMTGREFMQYHYDLAQQPPEHGAAKCDQLLALVELQEHCWALPIKKYSRGMLQRLGFAQALIGNPKYLLLDEPASGIDPAGVLLVRRLLKDLKARGVTIVLNSHQLDQVEKVCDRVAFIKSGKVDAIEDLQQGPDETTKILIRWKAGSTVPASATLSELASKAGALLLEAQSDAAVFEVPHADAITETIRQMILAGYKVIQVTQKDSRLERFFLQDQLKGEQAPGISS